MVCGKGFDVSCGKVIDSANVDFMRRSSDVWGCINCGSEVVLNDLL